MTHPTSPSNSPRLEDDDIVRTAVNNDGLQFLHVSPRLRHDRDLLLLAVKRSPRALAHALVDQIHDQEAEERSRKIADV